MALYDYNANETGSTLIPTPATLLRTLLGLRSVKSYMVTSRLDTSCCLKASKDNCILKIIKDAEDFFLHLRVAYNSLQEPVTYYFGCISLPVMMVGCF